MKNALLIIFTIPLLTGCASMAVTPEALDKRTAFALGLETGQFTISNRQDDGFRTDYTVITNKGVKFNCYVSGGITFAGRTVSDAVCSKPGQQTRNALLDRAHMAATDPIAPPNAQPVVKSSASPVIVNSKTSAEPQSINAPKMYVVISKTNLRKNPSTKADIVKILKKGEQVQEIMHKHDWIQVKRSSGEVGWCKKKALIQLDKS